MSSSHGRLRPMARTRLRPPRSGRGPGAAGFTLLEVTIILAVIAILGLILAPSVINFLNQSRLARAQADVEAMADAVREFYTDNGFFPKYADAGRAQEIRLLVSPGAVAEPSGPAAAGWTLTDPGLVDLISNQLINNKPSFGNAGYPLMTSVSETGWNGPYLNGPVESDPWGNRYVINVEFLSVMLGAVEADGVQEKRAVWALSAGPDGIVDTVYPTETVQLLGSAAASPLDISARIQ